MQQAMQDLADFMFKEDAKKAKDPQSWSTIGLEQNTSSQVFRFITEISQRDREILHQLLAGCKRMNLLHDNVFAGCNPCLLADLIVGASDDVVREMRKCLMALQVAILIKCTHDTTAHSLKWAMWICTASHPAFD